MTPIPDPFEQSLKTVRPAPPPARLAAAIGRELGPTADARWMRRARRAAVSWLPWGIAAAMAVALLTRPRGIDTTAPTPQTPVEPGPPAAGTGAPTFTPVSSTNTLVGALDEGVVDLGNGRLARKLRFEYLDTVRLRGTGDAPAVVNVSYPREEIRLVPVQTF